MTRAASRLSRRRLTAVYLLLSLGPLTLLTFFSVAASRSEAAYIADQRLLAAAQFGAAYVEQQLTAVRADAVQRATRPQLVAAVRGGPGGYDHAAITTLLRQWSRSRPDAADAFVTDAAGVVIDSVPGQSTAGAREWSSSDWYRGALSTPSGYVSEGLISPGDGRTVVVAGAAAIRDGQAGGVLGVMVVTQRLDAIHEYVDRFARDKQLQLKVIDPRGRPLIAPGSPPMGPLAASLVSDGRVAAALAGSSGTSRKEAASGLSLSGYAPVPGFGWAVLAEVPASVVLAGADRLTWGLVGLAALLALVLLGGLVAIDRSLRAREMAEDRLLKQSGQLTTQRLAAEQARRESEAKSRFLATMSHELRTPLNSILGFAQLLALPENRLGARQRRHVSNILTSGQHLLDLINDLLDVSLIQAGAARVKVEEVALENLLAEAVLVAGQAADAKGVELLVRPGGGGAVQADRRRLLQVLLNLLGNAVRFTPPGGRVEIGSDRAGDEVRVIVADSGIGIAAEQRERIFEEFVQLDSGPRREHDGTGLGLALSRGFVRLMGGDIKVESEPGLGSTFTVTLPAAATEPSHQLAAVG